MEKFTRLDLFGDGTVSNEQDDAVEFKPIEQDPEPAAAEQPVKPEATAKAEPQQPADPCPTKAQEQPQPTCCNDNAEQLEALAKQNEQLAAQNEQLTKQNEQLAKHYEKLEQLLTAQQQLQSSVESLNSLFNARIMHTTHEEKIVDQMHKELQKYKDDMYAQLVRPILLDVIAIRDSIMRMSATYLAKPEGEQSIPNKTFADYSYDLQDILEKNNVEIYRSQAGDDYTPIKQRAIKKVATPDQALHGKVAESFSCGYQYNDKTISAEKIAVYFYEKPAETNQDSEVTENG